MNSARQLVKTVIRQRGVLSATKCQRSLHTCLVLKADNNNTNTEALTDKFVNQVKKQRQIPKVRPTRFVQIESLPTTATTEDINRLVREAIPNSSNNIIEIAFCRNFEFNFTGRCVIAMATEQDARNLVEYGNRRALGGKILKMSYISNNNNLDNSSVMSRFRPSELFSITDSSSAAGRSVVISGLPPKTKPEHVLGYLRSRNFFPVEGTTDNVLRLKTKEQSTVSKFLVKFDSESEAWRCVRAFHNIDFLLQQSNQKFKLHLNVAY